MAFDSLGKGMGDRTRPIDLGKVETDGKSGMNQEKMQGAIMKMKSAMDEVLQMMGPNTSQMEVSDRYNPAETTGYPKMRDQDKAMKRNLIIAKLKKM